MSASTAGRLDVESEVGVLRRVILHRPGAELERLTPTNRRELLFDEVLWVQRAQEEHDAFAAALADQGVEVLLLDHMLTDVLALPEARAEVLAGTLRAAVLGHRLEEPVAEWLAGLEPGRLAERLIAGVHRSELPFDVDALPFRVTTATASSSRRCRTTSTRATRRPGSEPACRSARWRIPRAAARRSTSTRSTATTRCSARRTRCGATTWAARRASRAATCSSWAGAA